MKNFLLKYKPVFDAADLGGGGGGSGDGWSAPQGLPSEFAGSNADETLGKLLGGYTDLNTRFGGMRDKLSKMPAAPEKADMYAFEPGDNLKPYFGDLSQDPVFASARSAAHKHGLSQDQFSGFISDLYSPLVEQGVLARPFDPGAELKSFQTATGMDARSTQEALVASETFAKGLINQLKDVPDTLKNDVNAMLLGMTDTAAGNVLLRALSGRLSENGIRVEGQGGAEGALTADDLKKLDTDPRIDPRNRDHTDPNQRYDESLRKRYDEGYNRLYPSR